MSWLIRTIAVILLAIAGYYLLRYVHYGLAVQYRDMKFAMYGSGVVLWLYAVIGWTSVWYGMVKWTSFRKIGTILIAILSEPIGYILGIILSYGDKDFGWFLSALLPIAVFLIGTILLWIRYPQISFKSEPESLEVSCPKCGYSLRGLNQARCPECGGQFTLDQLALRKAS